jgi:predicted dehydrogenase
MSEKRPLRIAMLGAAKIGAWGVVQPARLVDGVELYSLAARDHERALSYAKKYQIPAVHESYESLLADSEIDAIYNPLPNALHCEWTIKALDAGKHVLCEKPFSSNADEARKMAEAAARNSRVLMEAMHYRFHPMAAKMQAAVAQLGAIHRIDTTMCVPLFFTKDIRYRYELGGGAGMDVGAYTVNLMRLLGEASGQEALAKNPRIESTQVKLRGEHIDRAMKVDVRWENGTTGQLHFSLWSSTPLKMSARVIGEHGDLKVSNPFLPHLFNKLQLRLGKQRIKEKVKGEATFTYQLQEFVNRIRQAERYPSDLSDSIGTMEMIDAIYDKAGLPRRGLSVNALKG